MDAQRHAAPHRPRRKRPIPAGMPKWLAWLLTAAILSLGLFLLWLGQVIVVRSERTSDGRVNVTLERRLFGLIPTQTETVRDVVRADLYEVVPASPGGERRRSSSALEITPRMGMPVVRARFGPAIGTQPRQMAPRINRFIRQADGALVFAPPLTLWWMPWLANLAALLFLLFPAAIFAERRLRL